MAKSVYDDAYTPNYAIDVPTEDNPSLVISQAIFFTLILTINALIVTLFPP